MAKFKTQTEILTDGIKDLNPLFQGYLVDRLEQSIKELTEQLPAWAESDASKNSMFHPNFFAQYINAINQIFDEIDFEKWRERHQGTKLEEIPDFQPRPKFPYFHD